MCGGYGCSRNALVLLNIVYMLVSFILMGVAGFAVTAMDLKNLAIVGGLVFCGVMLFIIALIGIIGACKHHQVLLFFYMVVLFLLFLVQLIVAVVCLGMSQKQQLLIFEQAWAKSPNVTKQQMQQKLQCCGFDKARLNATASDGMFHPSCLGIEACCGSPSDRDDHCCTGNGSPCNCQPCWEKVQYNLQTALHAAGGVGLFFSFTEIIGVWLAFRFRNLKNPRADPDAFL